MYSSTFGKGWVGMSACPLVVLACESLHVYTVCIWRCEHARFCVEGFYALYINFHSFIHQGSGEQTANLLTWRSGGSIQSDSIFLLKPAKLSFPLLFSPGFITVMSPRWLSSGSP